MVYPNYGCIQVGTIRYSEILVETLNELFRLLEPRQLGLVISSLLLRQHQLYHFLLMQLEYTLYGPLLV